MKLLLLDLDGTLVDTAPDMAGACNALRAEAGLEPVPVAALRNYVSKGAIGVLGAGMPDPGNEVEGETRRERFLALYAARIADESRPFRGMDPVLRAWEVEGRRWGVVTNKPGWLARPLLERLGLAARAAVIVSGDCLAERKPHPLPLLHAAERCGVEPGDCIYVGDDERDIVAGKAAGMRTAVAQWGYILPGEDPGDWGADWLCRDPAALLNTLQALA